MDPLQGLFCFVVGSKRPLRSLAGTVFHRLRGRIDRCNGTRSGTAHGKKGRSWRAEIPSPSLPPTLPIARSVRWRPPMAAMPRGGGGEQTVNGYRLTWEGRPADPVDAGGGAELTRRSPDVRLAKVVAVLQRPAGRLTEVEDHDV